VTESISLFGGPKDGALIEVSATPPLDYRIPIPPGWSWVKTDIAMEPSFRIGIYTPRCNTYGHVECNLAGHPIYEWRGERNG